MKTKGKQKASQLETLYTEAVKVGPEVQGAGEENIHGKLCFHRLQKNKNRKSHM